MDLRDPRAPKDHPVRRDALDLVDPRDLRARRDAPEPVVLRDRVVKLDLKAPQAQQDQSDQLDLKDHLVLLVEQVPLVHPAPLDLRVRTESVNHATLLRLNTMLSSTHRSASSLLTNAIRRISASS